MNNSIDYQLILMIICQPFIEDKWDESYNPYQIAADAESDFNVLLWLHFFRHGFSEAGAYLTSPPARLGFMCLQKINAGRYTNPGDIEYLRSGLFLALQGLQSQGQNYCATRNLYCMIKDQL